jgi:hypothetical protein
LAYADGILSAEAIPSALEVADRSRENRDLIGGSAEDHIAAPMQQAPNATCSMAMIHYTVFHATPFAVHRFTAHSAPSSLIFKHLQEGFKRQAIFVLQLASLGADCSLLRCHSCSLRGHKLFGSRWIAKSPIFILLSITILAVAKASILASSRTAEFFNDNVQCFSHIWARQPLGWPTVE